MKFDQLTAGLAEGKIFGMGRGPALEIVAFSNSLWHDLTKGVANTIGHHIGDAVDNAYFKEKEIQKIDNARLRAIKRCSLWMKVIAQAVEYIEPNIEHLKRSKGDDIYQVLMKRFQPSIEALLSNMDVIWLSTLMSVNDIVGEDEVNLHQQLYYIYEPTRNYGRNKIDSAKSLAAWFEYIELVFDYIEANREENPKYMPQMPNKVDNN